MMPSISVGVVTAHSPGEHGVIVSLRTSGQNIVVPVRIGLHHSADALRIKQVPLPGVGTWGIIAMPYGDIRNATWLCSYFPSFMSCFNVSQNLDDPLDPFMEYDSHFSGYWRSLNGSGYTANVWPDGSSLVVASGSGVPTVYRTIVDQSTNVAKRIPFTTADRISRQPTPFWAAFAHAAGTTVSVDPSGNVLVAAVTGATISYTVGSGSTVVQSATGITGTVGNASILVKNNQILLTVGSATYNFGPSKLVSSVDAIFVGISSSGHAHSDPQGGNTGPPM